MEVKEFLTEDQLAVREGIRALVEREIAPRAAGYDRRAEFPWDSWKALCDHGYVGMSLPEEYGGSGLDMVSLVICVEEISRGCAATGVIFEVHNTLCAATIHRFGSPAQRSRYLPDLATGRKIGAFAITEPGAGSDVGAITTSARREGDQWVLNGRKCFITSAGVADIYVLFAVTDPSKGTRGISAFVVEKGLPGLSFGKPEDKLGIRASVTADVVLEDCRLPADAMLGQPGDGIKIALSALDDGRIGIAAQAVGIAQAAYEAARSHALQRVQFGRPIAEFQAIQWMLADMATDIEAARLLTWRAARAADLGMRHTKEAAMAKLFASRMAMKHTVAAVQILGGYGYTREYPVERHLRDAKITEIYEGTSEIMRLVVARQILKEVAS